MSRIGALVSLALVIGLGVIAAWGCSEREASGPEATTREAEGQPNVVVYLIDTLRADHLGAYGYERDTSPTIDALAEEAILFEYAHAPSSWTRASVGSLFTGLFPSRHGAVRRDHRLRKDVLTLAELLQESGYSTAAFIANPNVLPVFGFERGFDSVFDIHSIHGSDRGDAVNASLLAYLDQGPREPFFLYVHAMDPHNPYRPPPPFDERFSTEPGIEDEQARLARARAARYDGEIAYADQQLGRLLDRLRAGEWLDDTLFILLSDHGEEFLEHGDFYHGRTLFEEQLRVPLLIRLPGAQGGGRRVSRPVRIVDLLPSIAELLALPRRSDETASGFAALDGRSFAALLRDEPGGGPAASDPLLFAELNLDHNLVWSLRDGDEKVIVRQEPAVALAEETLLFDLGRDPGERHNRASAAPERSERLLAKLNSIVQGLTVGTTVELINASGLETEHRVEIVASSSEGRFVGVEGGSLEAGDRIRLSEDERRVVLESRLRNVPDPAHPVPNFVVDSDQLRFQLDPPGAGWKLSAREGAEPLDQYRFRFGQAPTSHIRRLPLRLPDPSIDFRVAHAAFPPLPLRPGASPYIRIYEVAPIENRAEIDSALDDRLRALGYLGTEPAPGLGATRRDELRAPRRGTP